LSPCVGGVLKAIFGNAILLTVGVWGAQSQQAWLIIAQISIMALEHGSARMVQLSMLGSVLANTLLVRKQSISYVDRAKLIRLSGVVSLLAA
jgi:hypothetical protein